MFALHVFNLGSTPDAPYRLPAKPGKITEHRARSKAREWPGVALKPKYKHKTKKWKEKKKKGDINLELLKI